MRRLVVKVGSSSLTDASGRIEPPRLWAIARAVMGLGAEVAVVSSGAVAAGRGLLGAPRPTTLPQKQALAAVGQAVLMQEWARAFAPRPRLLLADEPTGNLDVATGKTVMDLLFGMQERYGTTLLLITHDPALAARCARRVRIADGRVAESVSA